MDVRRLMSKKGSLRPFVRCAALLSKMLARAARLEDELVAEAGVDD
jgi:hypothetical protein